jgi:hypothetical protein
MDMNNMTMDHSHHNHEETTTKDYFLFGGVILFIFLMSFLLEYLKDGFSGQRLMREFMGVFFLVFGIFKLLDLKGFVMSYIGYDVIARKFTGYAYAYPFIELLLALGYFLNIFATNYATLILMVIGSIGVTRELLRGSKIKCACLGTYIKLPLTTVSLVEDLSMGAMALALILYK